MLKELIRKSNIDYKDIINMFNKINELIEEANEQAEVIAANNKKIAELEKKLEEGVYG